MLRASAFSDTGKVCIIHHCFPSIEMEQAVSGIMAGSIPSKTGIVLSAIPSTPSSPSIASFPITAVPTARITIIIAPTIVFVTYTTEEK